MHRSEKRRIKEQRKQADVLLSKMTAIEKQIEEAASMYATMYATREVLLKLATTRSPDFIGLSKRITHDNLRAYNDCLAMLQQFVAKVEGTQP